MNIKKIFILVATIFLIQNSQAQKNLVINASFEDELDGWNAYGAQTTAWVTKNGKTACAVVSYDDTKWLGMHQIITLPKNAAAVEISAWIKPDNIIPGNEQWKKGIVNIDFLGADEKKVGEGVEVGGVVGSSDWVNHIKYVLVPQNAKKFQINVAMGFATGTLFVDDINCKVISKEEFDKQNAIGNVEIKAVAPEVIKPVFYLLKSLTENKLAMVKDASTEDNAIVIFATLAKENENQQWEISDLQNGFYKIVAVHSKKAIQQMGQKVFQNNWMGDDEAQWKIEKTAKGFICTNKVTKQPLKIDDTSEWGIDGFKL